MFFSPIKFFILLLFPLFFILGCESAPTQEEKAKQIAIEKANFEKKVAESKEVQLQKLSAQTTKELAVLESQKELAKIEKEKELEKIRLQAELEKQKIEMELEKEKALFEQNLTLHTQDNSMELKRYGIFIFALLLGVGLYFLYLYFKHKREDELRAYNDNLQKYFHEKENMTRARIAEKLLDTIASGKLDKEDEHLLIQSFSNQQNGSKDNDVEVIKEIEHKKE